MAKNVPKDGVSVKFTEREVQISVFLLSHVCMCTSKKVFTRVMPIFGFQYYTDPTLYMYNSPSKEPGCLLFIDETHTRSRIGHRIIFGKS